MGLLNFFIALKLFTTHLIAYILGHEACQGGTDKWLPTEEHYLSPRIDLVFQKVAGITEDYGHLMMHCQPLCYCYFVNSKLFF